MARLLQLPENNNGRDFIIGDIHGMLSLLQAALAQVGFNPVVDRLLFTGDLVNRGVDSLATLRYLQNPWCFSAIGNHDVMSWRHAKGEDLQEWLHAHGGQWVEPHSRDVLHQTWRAIRARMAWVLAVGTPASNTGYLVVHTPPWDGQVRRLMNPGTILSRLPDLPADEFFWHRKVRTDLGRCPEFRQLPTIYSGHTVMPYPCRWREHAFIDLGAPRQPSMETGLCLVEHKTQDVWLSTAYGVQRSAWGRYCPSQWRRAG